MYSHTNPYYVPPLPYYPIYYPPYPQQPRVYPSVDTQQFKSSVKQFRLLMGQGSILLDKLAEAAFEEKIMTAAQHGKQQEVDQMIESIGLKVPVKTEYTPSGVKFILQTPTKTNEPFSCCALTISMKWGR